MWAEGDRVRREHQIWARSGGSHDRTVRILQLALPALVGALTAVMLFAPFSERGELSFLLAKDAIAVTPQRMRVERAVYRGRDNRDRPFTLAAGEAVQRSAADPIVRIRDMAARIELPEGPAQMTADAANYDPNRDVVDVAGPLNVATADGFRLGTGDVQIDLNRRRLQSGRAVSGTVPIGRFSANRITADLETRVVTLDGNARLRINQGALR